MKKKKILFVTEANFHTTGYSVYTKEVLSRLNKNPQLEVAELACFASPDDEGIKNTPWKIYPNIPPKNNEEAHKAYGTSMSNKFGEFTYNHVLLDFKPDFVMDIRDWWMLEFEERSPFRDFYNWAIMPTVDAEPQNFQWINTYSTADAVFTYSEFARDVLKTQSDKINFVDVASPCASNSFFKIEDKEKLRAEFGLNSDCIIFGTVMRNQRRKLYPDLLKAFRDFLDKTNNPNVYLYCHTTYPDVGWDFPELLNKYGLGNRVLFSYKCKHCGVVYSAFFNDAIKFCPSCQQLASTMVGIGNRIEEDVLNKVYNLFDVYIQWANSEGWGMPQLEAAYAGLPVISVDYSAMSSLVHNINGIPIKPIGFYKELETGCLRAVPDNENLVTQMECMLNKNFRDAVASACCENAKTIYNWDYTADKWAKYFLSTPVKDESETWNSPPKLFNPATRYPQEILNAPPSDQANWLFINVLGLPNLINGSLWKKTVKDLTYRSAISGNIPGYYYNDYSFPDSEKRIEEFSFNNAFEYFLHLRNNYNEWEKLRTKK